MNCANHPETAAVAYCRTCGKPLCQVCERPAQGTVFCQEHVARRGAGSQPLHGAASRNPVRVALCCRSRRAFPRTRLCPRLDSWCRGYL